MNGAKQFVAMDDIIRYILTSFTAKSAAAMKIGVVVSIVLLINTVRSVPSDGTTRLRLLIRQLQQSDVERPPKPREYETYPGQRLSYHHILSYNYLEQLYTVLLSSDSELDHQLLFNMLRDLIPNTNSAQNRLLRECINENVNDLTNSNDLLQLRRLSRTQSADQQIAKRCADFVKSALRYFFWRRDNLVIGPTDRTRDRGQLYDSEILFLLDTDAYFDYIDFRRNVVAMINATADERDDLRDDLYRSHLATLARLPNPRLYNPSEWELDTGSARESRIDALFLQIEANHDILPRGRSHNQRVGNRYVARYPAEVPAIDHNRFCQEQIQLLRIQLQQRQYSLEEFLEIHRLIGSLLNGDLTRYEFLYQYYSHLHQEFQPHISYDDTVQSIYNELQQSMNNVPAVAVIINGIGNTIVDRVVRRKASENYLQNICRHLYYKYHSTDLDMNNNEQQMRVLGFEIERDNPEASSTGNKRITFSILKQKIREILVKLAEPLYQEGYYRFENSSSTDRRDDDDDDDGYYVNKYRLYYRDALQNFVITQDLEVLKADQQYEQPSGSRYTYYTYDIHRSPLNITIDTYKRCENCYSPKVQYILTETCDDNWPTEQQKSQAFRDWTDFYDSMHLDTFDSVNFDRFQDGSYAVGVSTTEDLQFDSITKALTNLDASLMLKSAMTGRFLKSNHDITLLRKRSADSRPVKNGVFIVDRNGIPTVISIKEKSNEISFNYNVNGTWIHGNNHKWKEIFRNTTLSKDVISPSTTGVRCHNGLVSENLVSLQKILDDTCWISKSQGFADWIVMLKYLKPSNLQNFLGVEFLDGSYAVPFDAPTSPKKNMKGEWIMNTWTPMKYRSNKPKEDFGNGPYYGIYIVDRLGKPTLAILQTNTQYLHVVYYENRQWKWVHYNELNRLFFANGTNYGLSKDLNARSVYRCYGKPVSIIH